MFFTFNSCSPYDLEPMAPGARFRNASYVKKIYKFWYYKKDQYLSTDLFVLFQILSRLVVFTLISAFSNKPYGFYYSKYQKRPVSLLIFFPLTWQRPTLTGGNPQLPSAPESLTSVFGFRLAISGESLRLACSFRSSCARRTHIPVFSLCASSTFLLLPSLGLAGLLWFLLFQINLTVFITLNIKKDQYLY